MKKESEKAITFGDIENYIIRVGLFVDPKYVWDFWEKRGWKSKKGNPMKRIEAIVDIANDEWVNEAKEKNISLYEETDETAINTLVDEFIKGLRKYGYGNIFIAATNSDDDDILSSLVGNSMDLIKKTAGLMCEKKAAFEYIAYSDALYQALNESDEDLIESNRKVYIRGDKDNPQGVIGALLEYGAKKYGNEMLDQEIQEAAADPETFFYIDTDGYISLTETIPDACKKTGWKEIYAK